MRFHSIISIGLFIVVFIGCSSDNEKETAATSSDEKSGVVIDRHVQAFMDNDIDAILADYTEESRIFTPDSLYTGLEQIRSFMEVIVPLFPKDSTNLITDNRIISGNTVYIVWHGESAKVEVPFASDTFIVENDKIVTQTVAPVIKMKG